MRRLFLGMAAVLLLTVGIALAVPQAALAVNFLGDACQGAGANSSACSGTGQDNITGTEGIILRAANLISIIGGVTAVIMIIIGGFMFVTAGGDTNQHETARKTVIYALVGLVVITFSRAIVAFVVTRV